MKHLQNKKFTYLLSTPSKIKNWVLLVGAVIFLGICVIGLRLNNLHMIDLRNEVLVADQKGQGIKVALRELEDFVNSHMNTGLGQPLELIYSYDRAVQAAREAAADTGVDTSIYQAAQTECERADIPLTARAQCIQEYVLNNTPPGQEIPEIDLPDREPFIYDFEPSIWSFDLPGVSLFASLYLVVVVIARKLANLLAVRHLKSKGLDELLSTKVDSLDE